MERKDWDNVIALILALHGETLVKTWPCGYDEMYYPFDELYAAGVDPELVAYDALGWVGCVPDRQLELDSRASEIWEAWPNVERHLHRPIDEFREQMDRGSVYMSKASHKIVCAAFHANAREDYGYWTMRSWNDAVRGGIVFA